MDGSECACHPMHSPQWGVCLWDAARQGGWSFQGNLHMVSLALEIKGFWGR